MITLPHKHGKQLLFLITRRKFVYNTKIQTHCVVNEVMFDYKGIMHTFTVQNSNLIVINNRNTYRQLQQQTLDLII